MLASTWKERFVCFCAGAAFHALMVWSEAEHKGNPAQTAPHVATFLYEFAAAFALGVGVVMWRRHGWKWQPVLIVVVSFALIAALPWVAPADPIVMTLLLGYWAATGFDWKTRPTQHRTPSTQHR